MRIKESVLAALPTKKDFIPLLHNHFHTRLDILLLILGRNLGKRRIKSDYQK